MKNVITDETKAEIVVRINNGIDRLNEAQCEAFADWDAKFATSVKRTRANYTRKHLIVVFDKIRELYSVQSALVAEEKFDFATMSFGQKARFRAGKIKSALAEVTRLTKSGADLKLIARAKAGVKAATEYRTPDA